MANGFKYQGARWQRLRRLHLSIEPLCRACKRLGYSVTAQHVDHVVPIAQAPALAYDLANLQSLCVSCHSVKTQTEDRGTGERGADSDGFPVDPGHPWNA